MAIGFTCVCGNSLRANESYAGLTVSCPRCNALLTVPSKNPSPAPGTAVLSSSVLPRTARRRQVVWRTGSIALALALILGLAAACFMKARAKRTVDKAHLDLIPRDATAFATCRLSALWQKLLQDESIAGRGLRIEDDCRNRFGLPPSEIERLTWLLLEADGQPIVLVTALNPVDQDDVDTLVAPDAQNRRHDQSIYHLSPNGTAVSFVDPKTYVIGDEQAMEQWLERAEHSASTGSLASALDRAARDDDHLVAAVAMSEPLRRRYIRAENLRTLAAFQDATLIANFDTTFHYRFRASYSDPDKALEAQQDLGVIREQMTRWISERPPKWLMPRFFRHALMSLLNGVLSTTDGSTLHVDGQARAGDLLTVESNQWALGLALGAAELLPPRHEPRPK